MTQTPWRLTPHQVLQTSEVSFLIFHNVYAEGKQGGLEIIQHDERVVTNGDLRLEAAPGQWAPLPVVKSRAVDGQAVTVSLAFEKQGVKYTVSAQPEGEGIRVFVDLLEPLPGEYAGHAGFNLEILPSAYFGKSYLMDGRFGVFPRQGNGPLAAQPGDGLAPQPLAQGASLVIAPEDPYRQITVQSNSGEMMLFDGRDTAANNWFVLRAQLPLGASGRVVDWLINPNRASGWMRRPAILYSQVGYHPAQQKQALIEMDPRAANPDEVTLERVTPQGLQPVMAKAPEAAGTWLHYRYARFDFSPVQEPGMYVLAFEGQRTMPFKIAADVYADGVYQPTLDTFMPVQMCHMRVEDGMRIWHGACHLDDAIQAPPNHKHFDGYVQYEETESPYGAFERVPHLDRGGWHDAGDYDLATGSQASTTLDFALIYETFGLKSDQTTVRRGERLVLLHTPDGIPDVVQQVAHGVEILLGGYHAAGHSVTGIIEGSLKQYVHLGDAATMTDNAPYDPEAPAGPFEEGTFGKRDDRWVFTNHDTALEYQVAGALAAASRVLKGYEDGLAGESLQTALKSWDYEHSHAPVSRPNCYTPRDVQGTEVIAAVELLLATGEERFTRRLVELAEVIEKRFEWIGWSVARVLDRIGDEAFSARMRAAARAYQVKLVKDESESPFRLPFGEGWLRAGRAGHDPFAPDYHPPIWGVGWSLQRFAVHFYYLVTTYPDLFDRESLLRVLNYVLGCHPANNLSLTSGVGAQSLTVAYGTNRAEWSYIPGGNASGPALIRPDFIELMDPWPFLWQQKEYVLSGATSYIFLVLAADRLLNGETE